MARAYGSDRLELAPDGVRVVLTRRSKGWLARRPATQIRAAHPGTAVRWDDELWEVMGASRRADGSVRYELAPWDEQHILRVISDYSEAAEKARAEAIASERRDDRTRGLLLLLSPLAGHLPGHVQERLERRYGASGVLMTMISAAPLAGYGTYCAFMTLADLFGGMYGTGAVGGRLGLPTPSLPMRVGGLYLLVESGLRMSIALHQSRPAGSLLGTLLHGIARPRDVSRPEPEMEPDGEQALRDAYAMREPLLTFLHPAEQKLLAARFGFDRRRWGMRMSIATLVVALITGLTARAVLATGDGGLLDVLMVLGSAYLAVEQVVRLAALRRGDVRGSVLGGLVRRVSRKILA